MENCCSLHKQSYYFNKLFTTKVFSLCLSPSRYCPCTLFATAIFIQLRLLLGWVSISIRNLDLDGVSVIVCAVAVCMRVRVSRFSSSPKYNVPTRIIRLWTEKATFLDTPKSNSFTFRFAVTYVMLFLVMLFAFFFIFSLHLLKNDFFFSCAIVFVCRFRLCRAMQSYIPFVCHKRIYIMRIQRAYFRASSGSGKGGY